MESPSSPKFRALGVYFDYKVSLVMIELNDLTLSNGSLLKLAEDGSHRREMTGIPYLFSLRILHRKSPISQ